jgi:microcystin-dependent protein|tara:strand:+ start:1687 stop:2259 length:573 start_codon:yes stop_codon:yes gene_type:complete
MSNYEATRYNFTGADLTGIEGIPTATIVPWSTSSVPTGFLECNGAAVSRSTYSALFAIVGTTYGSGDGASTFNVPNLADNVAVGKSNNKALASTGGANTVTSTGNVAGSTANASLSEAQLASHAHGGSAKNSPHALQGASASSYYLLQAPNSTNNTGSGSGHSHNMSANFVGDATSVLQPYLAVTYIIKT